VHNRLFFSLLVVYNPFLLVFSLNKINGIAVYICLLDSRYRRLFFKVYACPPARVPKRRAKAQKPANPWLALPRLAALFDSSTQQNFLKGSKVPELEELALTESQLLEQTAALLGVSLAQLVRAGALVYAKREFLSHKKYIGGQDDQKF
jgi:hypothetical protein